MKRIFDSIRKSEIRAFPEEIVRQALLERMVFSLGYPKHFISVEKGLSSLPHLKNRRDLPKRRCDIICFSSEDRALYPLLLVECKSGKLKKSAKDQLIGYNSFVGAYFLALANEREVVTFWKVEGGYSSLNFLPTYEQLKDAVRDR